jgi:hypothetical protein
MAEYCPRSSFDINASTASINELLPAALELWITAARIIGNLIVVMV